MNLLNLLSPCNGNPKNIFYLYANDRFKTQKYVKTLARIFESASIHVIKRPCDELTNIPDNVTVTNFDLSLPYLVPEGNVWNGLSPNEETRLQDLLKSKPWDLILFQGNLHISLEPYNHFRFFPSLLDHYKTTKICYIKDNFEYFPINEIIERWRSPVHLKDAEFTLDCPGHISARESAWLERLSYKRPQSEYVVEIGRYRGRSTLALAHGIRRSAEGKLITIDPWLQEDVHDNLKRHNLSDLVEVWTNSSRGAFERWNTEGQGQSIGMIFIDGNHTYEYVHNDISQWSTVLVPNGIIALHDYSDNNDGTLLAVNELIFWSGNYSDIQGKDQLLIARKI